MAIGGPFVPINIVLSVLYYYYDIGVHIRSAHPKYIMIFHHILSMLLLVFAYLKEQQWVLRVGFFLIEFSNLPMYWAQFYLWSDHNQNHPIVPNLILLEIAAFIFIRCVWLTVFIIWFVKNAFVRGGLTFLLLGSIYWSYGLAKSYGRFSATPNKIITT
jgi:lysylphosphatidylglycerol synthetase-like protein (DUF2156 family)